MSLKTEYRGYDIRYSENGDTWDCYDCRVSEPSLSKAKAKIDAMHLKMRKAAALPCYEFGSVSPDTTRLPEFRVTESKIIDYMGPQMGGSSWGPFVEAHKVAAVSKRLGSDRAVRHTTGLENLLADTPELPAQVEEVKRLLAVAYAACREFRDAVAALPRVRFEDIMDLVAASKARIEEGE